MEFPIVTIILAFLSWLLGVITERNIFLIAASLFFIAAIVFIAMLVMFVF